MRQRHFVVTSLAMAGALALVGCTTESEPAPSAAPSAGASVTDAVTCTAFSDVLTITANADAGLRDGRMASQEQQGWYRLATRVLDRVPTSGAGVVNDAANALKDAAPIINLGKMSSSGIGSAEWNDGLDQLSFACTDVGFETAVQMFTGG